MVSRKMLEIDEYKIVKDFLDGIKVWKLIADAKKHTPENFKDLTIDGYPKVKQKCSVIVCIADKWATVRKLRQALKEQLETIAFEKKFIPVAININTKKVIITTINAEINIPNPISAHLTFLLIIIISSLFFISPT